MIVAERVELRPFEREIVERFTTFGKMMDPVRGVKGWKGVWIRGHLRDKRSDNVYGMWSSWEVFVDKAESLGAAIKPGTYQNFCVYVYTLRRLGLIREVRKPDLILRVMTSLGMSLYEEFRAHVNRLIPDPAARLPEYMVEPGRKAPRFYELVPRRVNDPAWMRPLQEAYPSTDWTKLSKREKTLRRLRYKRVKKKAG